MYFDVEDDKPDIGPLGGPLTWRDGAFLSIIVHLVGLIVILLGPKYFPFLAPAVRPRPIAVPAPNKEPMRFVFTQPKVDLKALTPPEKAPPSDIDRKATSPQPTPEPTNSLPTLRGNTREQVEQSLPEAAPEPSPEPQPSQLAENVPRVLDAPSPIPLPTNRAPAPMPRPPSSGTLGESLRNLQRYVQKDQFQNTQGSGAFGPAIQFDTKGVEFGPWIRRFIAQVKRNWEPLIPLSAMTSKGHVVVTFNVHKDGSITDLTVVGPSSISAFNTAAFGALASSNPTAVLPPEYPSDQAFFTVTFFYNEEPPQ
ncbi:MAG: TonB family protein [Vicinamibacterales bacterium]